jgi:hypothetical protein
MKLKIYGKSDPVKAPVRLRLVPSGSNVTLEAVDENGDRVDRGCLLLITRNGTIHRPRGVSRDLGFQLDSYGHIKVIP